MKMPRKVLVYTLECDPREGPSILAVAEDINEIVDDTDGLVVGVYTLHRQYKLRIKRELI